MYPDYKISFLRCPDLKFYVLPNLIYELMGSGEKNIKKKQQFKMLYIPQNFDMK